MELGYEATSYREIASACGCTRPLVQHYFPKKELLAIEFVKRLLILAETYVDEHGLRTGDDFADLYIIGQVYFSFLLADERMQRFSLDVVSSRPLTEQVLAFNASWALGYMDVAPAVDARRVTDDTIMAMGGFYEVLYQSLRGGRAFDIGYWLRKVLVEFMADFGRAHEDSDRALEAYALSSAESVRAAAWVGERF